MGRLLEDLLLLRDRLCGGGHPQHTCIEDTIECMTQNFPFYEQQAFEPIVWDGNTDGLESVDFTMSEEATVILYKVSDQIIDANDIATMTNVVIDLATSEETTHVNDIKAEGVPVQPANEAGTAMIVGEMNIFCCSEDVEIPLDTPITLTAGVWFSIIEMTGFRSYTAGCAAATTVTRLDEKFMPLLTSPNGTKYKLVVADDGTLSATAV